MEYLKTDRYLFLIISLIMLPIAYLSYWMEHSITGFLVYFGIFVLIFVIIWIVQLITIKHSVNKINEKLRRINK